jgi:hypothetical protein
MTWTQGERTPESDTNTMRQGVLNDNNSLNFFLKVDNTKYIRNMKDMKNSPNKEISPYVEQWRGCHYLNGAKYDR